MRWLLAIVELYLLLWFLVVGIEAFMQRSLGDESPFDLLELHHAFVGAALVALGFALHSVTGILLETLGLVVTIDDLVQHAVQTHGAGRAAREYRSPLHVLFARTLWRVPGVPRLVAFLDDRWWLLGILAGAAALVLSCGGRRLELVPSIARPDTRRIISFDVDSAIVRQAAELFQRALPNEASLCFDGVLAPRPDRPGFLHAHLTGVRPAIADSADAHHVYVTRHPKSGCHDGQLLAIAHDHPASGPFACAHSDPDAFVLFEDPRALFSLVFCPLGRGEILFQDGRRGNFVWAKIPP